MTEPVRPDLSALLLAHQRQKPIGVSAGYTEAMAWLTGQLGTVAHPIVLDVGCGTGLPAGKDLTLAGIKVVGIDPSPAAIDMARHNVPDAIYTERDLSDLDGLHPASSRFDAAISLFALASLPRTQIADTLTVIARVVKPASPLLLALPEGDADHAVHDFAGQRVPVTAYRQAGLRQLLGTSGWQVVDISTEPDGGGRADLYARCLAPTAAPP